MATADDPLIALEAWGAFGKTVIFTKAGDVRAYFKPDNPRSSKQSVTRVFFRAALNALHILSASSKSLLRTVSNPAYYWNAQGCKRFRAAALAHEEHYNALNDATRLSWQDWASMLQILDAVIPGQSAPSFTGGKALYMLAWTFFDAPLLTEPGTPNDNAKQWAIALAGIDSPYFADVLAFDDEPLALAGHAIIF